MSLTRSSRKRCHGSVWSDLGPIPNYESDKRAKEGPRSTQVALRGRDECYSALTLGHEESKSGETLRKLTCFAAKAVGKPRRVDSTPKSAWDWFFRQVKLDMVSASRPWLQYIKPCYLTSRPSSGVRITITENTRITRCGSSESAWPNVPHVCVQPAESMAATADAISQVVSATLLPERMFQKVRDVPFHYFAWIIKFGMDVSAQKAGQIKSLLKQAAAEGAWRAEQMWTFSTCVIIVSRSLWRFRFHFTSQVRVWLS